MLFNSLHFLFFLPLVVALYYLLAPRFRWPLIFIASCYFYMAFVPSYILILFFVILVDYFSGIFIEASKGTKRKLYLIISLLSNILLLAFFKYFAFLNTNLKDLLALFGTDFKPFHLDVILPIGLSFHTFQSMSYTIEVYRGTQKAERHIGYFANYVLFFPQMVAGPIERYDRLGNELRKEQSLRYKNLSEGFRMVLFGLFIKMVIADNIAPLVNLVYKNSLEHARTEVLAAVFMFSFQIYSDSFGYSTIAIGSAKLLGISIMDNFKSPYLSTSITEFWNKWHISLSTWFRDYLYIPLGGNRVSAVRWAFNTMVVFLISGLWHGASWTFVLWGALHGGMILLERIVKPMGEKLKTSTRLRPLLIAKTFVITSFIWVFFRAESFEKAKQIFQIIIHGNAKGQHDAGLRVAFFAALVLFSVDLWLQGGRFDMALRKLSFWQRWSIYAVLVFSIMAFAGAKKFSFIYFQF